MTADPERACLSMRDSLDVLAFLVSAARTQTDEAAEYGPMRLLMAARLLAERMAEHLADDVGDSALDSLVGEVSTLEIVTTPTRDREAYVASLDVLCERVADALLEREGRG